MSERTAQRRLAAILAADVVGYSRLMAADEAGTLSALKSRRREVLEPLVARYSGRVFKITGDGVLIEFGSAVNAVQCAIDLQQAFAAANADQDEGRHIVLRIGVHVGDVMVEGSDLYGDGINIAARLESLAEPGGVLLSEDARRQVGTKLQFGFEDLGPQALKNIDDPVRAYRVAIVGMMPRTAVSPGPSTAGLTDRPSIAVLPFTNMSGDPEQEYFSDGITEDIITDLSQVSGLFVAARNTSFTFKGKAVQIIHAARQMNVGHVLEGSVRKAGGRVRITVQLIDGKSGGHVWAERYDREFGDIFALQDEISKSVVAALRVKLLPEEIKSITERSTTSAEAYAYYLQGRATLFGAWGEIPTLRSAQRLFQKAVEIDANYARAYAGIADCEAQLWFAGESNISFDEILANSARAISITPNLAEAHSSRGTALWLSGDSDTAVKSLKRAIELDPNLFESHFYLAEAYRDIGTKAEAVVHFKRAMELRPTDYWSPLLLSNAFRELGQIEEANQMLERAHPLILSEIERRPNNANALAVEAGFCAAKGDIARAEECARRAIEYEPENWVARYNTACAYSSMKKPDAAVEQLDYIARNMPRVRRWVYTISKYDADLDGIRDRADFQALMQRLKAGSLATEQD